MKGVWLSLVAGAALMTGGLVLAGHVEGHHHGHECAHGGGFLPPNHLDLEDDISAGNVTEAQFKAVIAKAQAFYGPIVNEHGGTLTIANRWTDSTVNANASQFGTDWNVNMYGGLARRPEITADGFALVLCHEIGHHLAGHFFASTWAANEGQSDYFATQSCARELWAAEQAENAKARELVAAAPKAKCDEVWSNEEERNLCYRIMVASKSISDLLASLGGSRIDWGTPDRNAVSRTNNAHPKAQCRLDTYIAGALCVLNLDKDVIPGKDLGSQRNSAQAEREVMKFSCTTADDYTSGTRPLCWFKPQVQ